MLSGNCTEALSIQANVTISGSSAKLIKNDIAPLPFPALLKQCWYIKRGERVRVRGHAPFYATLGFPDRFHFADSTRILMLRNEHSSPWSVSMMWPLIFSPNPGAFLNLLLATPAFTASLPNSYSRTFFPFSQCST